MTLIRSWAWVAGGAIGLLVSACSASDSSSPVIGGAAGANDAGDASKTEGSTESGLDAATEDRPDGPHEVAAPSCTDGAQNGAETDVDCGGPTCPKCAATNKCAQAADCLSEVCTGNVCVAASCTDLAKNGTETDIDCGGATCPKCKDGMSCGSGGDCENASCQGGKCQAPSCSDNVENGLETDVDCGGSVCGPCADGKACKGATDCASAMCVGSVCQALSCNDGAKDGTETDIDCGGSACPKCKDMSSCQLASDCESAVCAVGTCLVPTCVDGATNGDETGVDCGGAKCPKCADLKGCALGSDCLSGVCVSNKCQPPGCGDGAMNGAETDIDCGGGLCLGCDDLLSCAVPSDCKSGVCDTDICQVPSCTDTVFNGIETDVDCGGGSCPQCDDLFSCVVPSDCKSAICNNAKCEPPSCTDSLLNGSESDIDCGGASCPKCNDLEICNTGGDCKSAVCSNGKCAAGTCIDGAKNGNETDVDCGGGACAKCQDGKLCAVPADCATSQCYQGKCGRRAWTVESLGSSVLIAANNTWTDAPINTINPVLAAPSLLLLRWTGTLRWGGGGNGVCHVGARFMVDGQPTGHPGWGDAIVVQQGAVRPHSYFSVEIALNVAAGSHSVSAQMANATGYSSCYLDGDGGLPYDRSRLAVTAYDLTEAWYAASTGETGPLGAASPWTDIPGASLTINPSQARHIQFSVQGTEYVQGTGSGHCGYRMVLDGTPLGDPNWGQAIAVTDASTGWWAPVGIKYGTDLDSGSHTLKVQARNGGSSATCNAAGNSLPYSRFHVMATASAPGAVSQSLESSGPAQILPASSPWTAIGGLSTSFQLTAASHVQFEVVGTQRTTSGSGQCAYRFVVDGTGQGDPNHGQGINIGDSAQTWWMAAGLLAGMDLTTGNHTVGVEVRNSGSPGVCGVNADALDYGRMRLLVRGP